jgi:hypothetical protein
LRAKVVGLSKRHKINSLLELWFVHQVGGIVSTHHLLAKWMVNAAYVYSFFITIMKANVIGVYHRHKIDSLLNKAFVSSQTYS